jgi:hypothetical protein
MKKSLFLLVAGVVFLLGSLHQAHASVCFTAFKKAAAKCAADPKCQKAAAELLIAFNKQVKLCKEHRQNLKLCRQTRQSARKSCNEEKRAAKRDCKKLKGSAKRQCNKEATNTKKACQRDARKEKQDCRNEARDNAAFEQCKDGRQITQKAGGRFAVCAAKHFLPAALVCAAALAAGGG